VASGIVIYTVAAAVLAAAAAFAVGGGRAGLQYLGGVSAGGLLIYINLIWLARLVRGLLTGPINKGRFALGLGLKVALLYGAASALIALRIVEAVPFLIGLSGLFVSVLAAGIRKKKEN
jgi:hypothetical protein